MGSIFSREETFARWMKRVIFGICFRESAKIGNFAGIDFHEFKSYIIYSILYYI